MAKAKHFKRVALFSIKPYYANLIMEGKKRTELRKTNIDPQVSFIVVYATYPVQKIVGYFSVKNITKGALSKIWQQHSKSACIERDDFESYYDGKERGVAIEISEVVSLSHPLKLVELDHKLIPPQSFTYMEWKTFNELRNLASAPLLQTSH